MEVKTIMKGFRLHLVTVLLCVLLLMYTYWYHRFKDIEHRKFLEHLSDTDVTRLHDVISQDIMISRDDRQRIGGDDLKDAKVDTISSEETNKEVITLTDTKYELITSEETKFSTNTSEEVKDNLMSTDEVNNDVITSERAEDDIITSNDTKDGMNTFKGPKDTTFNITKR